MPTVGRTRLYGPSPAVLRPTVRRGPRRGHKEQILLTLPRPANEGSEHLLEALTNELGKLPEVKEVVQDTSTQRGEESSRELVGLAVRFIKRVKPDEAERLVRRILKLMLKRLKRLSSSSLRAERRDRARLKRADTKSRQRVNDLNRWLGQPA